MRSFVLFEPVVNFHFRLSYIEGYSLVVRRRRARTVVPLNVYAVFVYVGFNGECVSVTSRIECVVLAVIVRTVVRRERCRTGSRILDGNIEVFFPVLLNGYRAEQVVPASVEFRPGRVSVGNYDCPCGNLPVERSCNRRGPVADYVVRIDGQVFEIANRDILADFVLDCGNKLRVRAVLRIVVCVIGGIEDIVEQVIEVGRKYKLYRIVFGGSRFERVNKLVGVVIPFYRRKVENGFVNLPFHFLGDDGVVIFRTVVSERRFGNVSACVQVSLVLCGYFKVRLFADELDRMAVTVVNEGYFLVGGRIQPLTRSEIVLGFHNGVDAVVVGVQPVNLFRIEFSFVYIEIEFRIAQLVARSVVGYAYKRKLNHILTGFGRHCNRLFGVNHRIIRNDDIVEGNHA